MSSPSPFLALVGITLLGLLECGSNQWGSHSGAVCSGPEQSLAPITQGVDLSGWWVVVPAQDTDRAPLENNFVLIDAAQFPRAWSESGGANYEKYQRHRSEWAFGCESYLDYPLVAGQENRSPAGERLTIPSGCSLSQGRTSDASSRRVLDHVQIEPSKICFHYDRWRFERDDLGVQGEGTSLRQVLCFGYDNALDQLKLSYASGGALPQVATYARYLEGSPQEQGVAELSPLGHGTGGTQ